ncbi:hypothetical protein FO440_18445 [Mucilaginibacter corticis]|uniref:Uncharacterized protein n=1 Tax=Mucilaginibacter corticis TaxID=2597670 RepID=A0A556MIK2_9SPHI|nr:hypothetical protein [Mucilaginibacter corticis]TSJ39718.1 hypothetical protein FO440_18445 [Mucilaginibacter corticis]
MKKLLYIIIFLGPFGGFAQRSTLDIASMHLLIDQSIDENKQQVKAKNQQITAAANEQANLTLLDKLKLRYRQLQQRYNALGTAINVADIDIYATPMVNRIISNQAAIIKLAEKNPALIALGLQTEIEFAGCARDLAGYIAGLTISIGDVNQLKASDRKLLFEYVLSELSRIQDISGTLVNNLQYATLSDLLKAANPFQNFVNADRTISKEIIQNAKYLKP